MKLILAALSLKATETHTAVSTAVGAIAGATVLGLPPLHAAFYGGLGALVGALSMMLTLLVANEAITAKQFFRVCGQAVLSILIGMLGAFVLSEGIVSLINGLVSGIFPQGVSDSVVRLVEFLLGLTMWRLVPAILDRAVKEVTDRKAP